jgi:hypothetical protein
MIRKRISFFSFGFMELFSLSGRVVDNFHNEAFAAQGTACAMARRAAVVNPPFQ